MRPQDAQRVVAHCERTGDAHTMQSLARLARRTARESQGSQRAYSLALADYLDGAQRLIRAVVDGRPDSARHWREWATRAWSVLLAAAAEAEVDHE